MYIVKDIYEATAVCDDVSHIVQWSANAGVPDTAIINYLHGYVNSVFMVKTNDGNKHYPIRVYEHIAQDLIRK